MTHFEEQLRNKLEKMKSDGKRIELQLRPGISRKSIERSGVNVAVINQRRDGEFKDVSESFYDDMVDMFDSRYQ